MSVQIQARRDATAVPLNLSVTKDGGVAGLTAKVAIRDGSTLASYLDFADNTFKAAGWTTRQATLSDVGAGFYTRVGGLNIAAIVNLPAATFLLCAEYEISGSDLGVAIDVIELSESQSQLDFLEAVALNRLRVNFTTQKLELYNVAGTSVIQTWPLVTFGGEPVSTQFGVQVERGKPDL